MPKHTNPRPDGYIGSHRKRPIYYVSGKHERREDLSLKAVSILCGALLASVAVSAVLGGGADAGKPEKANGPADVPFEQCHIAEIVQSDTYGRVVLPLAVVPHANAGQLLRQKVSVTTYTTGDTSDKAPQTLGIFRSKQVPGMAFQQPEVILQPPQRPQDGTEVGFTLEGASWQVACTDRVTYSRDSGWTLLPAPIPTGDPGAV